MARISVRELCPGRLVVVEMDERGQDVYQTPAMSAADLLEFADMFEQKTGCQLGAGVMRWLAWGGKVTEMPSVVRRELLRGRRSVDREGIVRMETSTGRDMVGPGGGRSGNGRV